MIDPIDLVLAFAQEFALSALERGEKPAQGGDAVIVEPRGKVERPVVGRASDPVAREVTEGRPLDAVEAVDVPAAPRGSDRLRMPGDIADDLPVRASRGRLARERAQLGRASDPAVLTVSSLSVNSSPSSVISLTVATHRAKPRWQASTLEAAAASCAARSATSRLSPS